MTFRDLVVKKKRKSKDVILTRFQPVCNYVISTRFQHVLMTLFQPVCIHGFIWEVHGSVKGGLRPSTGGQRRRWATIPNPAGCPDHCGVRPHLPGPWQPPADGMNRCSAPYSVEVCARRFRRRWRARTTTFLWTHSSRWPSVWTTVVSWDAS